MMVTPFCEFLAIVFHAMYVNQQLHLVPAFTGTFGHFVGVAIWLPLRNHAVHLIAGANTPRVSQFVIPLATRHSA